MATSKISAKRLIERDMKQLNISKSNVTGSANFYYNDFTGFILIDLTFADASAVWIDIGTYDVDQSMFSSGYANIEGAVFAIYTNNGKMTLRVSKVKAQNYRGTMMFLKDK